MNELITWAVYCNPRDFPGRFVVREWMASDGQVIPGRLLGVTDTLEQARSLIPAGAVRMEPRPGGDPVICEEWI